MADYSKYILNGQTLLVKDATARESIAHLESVVAELQTSLNELSEVVAQLSANNISEDSSIQDVK
jgi:hypothetical protein